MSSEYKFLSDDELDKLSGELFIKILEYRKELFNLNNNIDRTYLDINAIKYEIFQLNDILELLKKDIIEINNNIKNEQKKLNIDKIENMEKILYEKKRDYQNYKIEYDTKRHQLDTLIVHHGNYKIDVQNLKNMYEHYLTQYNNISNEKSNRKIQLIGKESSKSMVSPGSVIKKYIEDIPMDIDQPEYQPLLINPPEENKKWTWFFIIGIVSIAVIILTVTVSFIVSLIFPIGLFAGWLYFKPFETSILNITDKLEYEKYLHKYKYSFIMSPKYSDGTRGKKCDVWHVLSDQVLGKGMELYGVRSINELRNKSVMINSIMKSCRTMTSDISKLRQKMINAKVRGKKRTFWQWILF